MKKAGRVRLFCFKRLANGVRDAFHVVVSEKDEMSAKANYKSMGYDVSRE